MNRSPEPIPVFDPLQWIVFLVTLATVSLLRIFIHLDLRIVIGVVVLEIVFVTVIPRIRQIRRQRQEFEERRRERFESYRKELRDRSRQSH